MTPAPTTISRSDRYAQLELQIIREESWPGLHDLKSAISLLDRWGMTRQAQECIWVIAYDASLHIRTVIEVARGTMQGTDLHIPTVLSAVLTAGAERFMLVHNHPSGDVRPSGDDITTTKTILEAANACGLWMEDHLIVGPAGQLTSLASYGLFPTYPAVAAVAQP